MSNTLLSASRNLAFNPAKACKVPSASRSRSAVRASAFTFTSSRREALQAALLTTGGLLINGGVPAIAADSKPAATLSTSDLCDEQCFAALTSGQVVTTSSGLRYQDVVVGRGPSPPVGYQVVVNYVAMTPEGRAFDSSVAKGGPYDIRVGAGQVIPGLDEGLTSMKVGGIRRMYIPGDLAFPKGVPSAAGRPRIPPGSPVVFDVQLLYIPGLEADDE